MKILLDTNMLFINVRDKVDIKKQLNQDYPGKKEIIVLKDSLEELKKLKDKGVRDSLLALENVKKQGFKVLKTEGVKDVDTNIINTAKKQNAFIATNDKVLRKRAKEEGISTMAWVKSKKKIMVV